MTRDFYYLVCSYGRSGTNLLRFLLRRAQLGNPLELDLGDDLVVVPDCYAHQDFKHNFLQMSYCKSRQISVYSRTIWSFLYCETIKNLRREASVPDAISDKDLLGYLYPEIKCIHLYRRDIVRQGVSFVKAQKSGLWTYSNQDKENGVLPPCDIEYDFGDIAREIVWISDSYNQWVDIFNQCNFDVLPVVYEDFLDDMVGGIHRIQDFLGIEDEQVVISEQSLQCWLTHPNAPVSQSNNLNANWVDWFCGDFKKIKML